MREAAREHVLVLVTSVVYPVGLNEIGLQSPDCRVVVRRLDRHGLIRRHAALDQERIGWFG